MKAKIAVIGGSGIYSLDHTDSAFKVVGEIPATDTPYGMPSGNILELALTQNPGHKFYFLPRHGNNHQISPSEVNYRANIFALKQLGITHCISVSAVGSLKEEFPPTSIVCPLQFIDWTKGQRKRSFFDQGVVGHVSVAEPIDVNLHKLVVETVAPVLKQNNVKFGAGGTYVCIEGPQFSTKAESNIYRSFGADIIGMTNVPESYLAKEAGIAYATIALVTDYDCWKEAHCTLEEIMKVMKQNYHTANLCLQKLIPALHLNPPEVIKENLFAVVTKPQAIPVNMISALDVLIS